MRTAPTDESLIDQAPTLPKHVSALGRIEPGVGLLRLAGPPHPAVTIERLEVEEGDEVLPEQVIATVEGSMVLLAEVERSRAELEIAERDLKRQEKLHSARSQSEAVLDEAKLRVKTAQAILARAEADLELSIVRAPIAGTILKVHARRGERVDERGIVELGDTSRMFVVAEVYEDDIRRVLIGQAARISSPSLPAILTGRVSRIGLLVNKKDVLDTDPVADADARVVEVRIRLDDPAAVARLTNLRVDVVIVGGGEGP